ncbi:MAG: hypothetical protein QME58_12460 [Bacteroidota bacterium]|nr:hypothetical protein [Bacteroidota bacterium]
MARYRKGRLVGEIIKQLPTAGLPLFATSKEDLRDYKILIAPKYIETGTIQRDESYKAVCNDLPRCQKQVYNAFKELGFATDREISVYYNIPVNRVTARRNELLELGLIVKAGVIFDDETKREVNLWKTKEGD